MGRGRVSSRTGGALVVKESAAGAAADPLHGLTPMPAWKLTLGDQREIRSSIGSSDGMNADFKAAKLGKETRWMIDDVAPEFYTVPDPSPVRIAVPRRDTSAVVLRAPEGWHTSDPRVSMGMDLLAARVKQALSWRVNSHSKHTGAGGEYHLIKYR